MYDLSILVCSVHTRRRTFAPKILDQLYGQYESLSEADRARVEILFFMDAKSMTIGDKRNRLVELAQGRYVQFVDDDDRVAPNMMASVLGAIDDSAPDVVTFLAEVRLNGGAAKVCHYSKDFTEDKNTQAGYERLPNHLCAVKRDLALKARFPSTSWAEDSEFGKRLLPLLSTEAHVSRVLYYYDYNTSTTETSAKNARAEKTTVDVVMMSNAKTAEIQRMTQEAIDTCRKGAGDHDIRVIVMEQQPVKYEGAETIRPRGEFNYNAFANRGARRGNAEWIVFANNDLRFDSNWLDALLVANHPLVSPKSPNDPRQRLINRNVKGYTNPQHLSGWCFMIKRSLWKQFGGLDESFNFWCSDDATIEQARQAGVEPMLVPLSVVHHLGSVTLRSIPDADDLTWKNVHAFNVKYGQDKFANDRRFIQWKSRNLA